MPDFVPPTGFLSDIVGSIEKMVPNLPGPFDEMIKDAVNTAVAVVDPNTPTPQLPAPPPVIHPDATPEQASTILKAFDSVIDALTTILKFKFVIPDSAEGPLEFLLKVVVLVRSWVD
jgi:hypothetical protein